MPPEAFSRSRARALAPAPDGGPARGGGAESEAEGVAEAEAEAEGGGGGAVRLAFREVARAETARARRAADASPRHLGRRGRWRWALPPLRHFAGPALPRPEGGGRRLPPRRRRGRRRRDRLRPPPHAPRRPPLHRPLGSLRLRLCVR